MRLLKYGVVNPYLDFWGCWPSKKVAHGLKDILASYAPDGFEVIIDHGCSDGCHFSKILESIGRHVWGVDIIEPEQVHYVDRYLRVSTEVRESYFDEVPDGVVDCVVVLNGIGFHPKSTWERYVTAPNARVNRYFQELNYLRLLRPGGIVLLAEWEAYPERRFGRGKKEELLGRSDDLYKPMAAPGFELIDSGYRDEFQGPYMVWRKST